MPNNTYNVTVSGPNQVSPMSLAVATGQNSIVWSLSGNITWSGSGVVINATSGNGKGWPGNRTPSLNSSNQYVLSYNNNMGSGTGSAVFTYSVSTANLGTTFMPGPEAGGSDPVIENQGGGPWGGGVDPDND